MVDYPIDLQLNSDKDIFLDGANDLATVGGVEQLEQSVAIDVMDEIQDFIGGRVRGKSVGLLEERVRQALNDDPQLSEIRQVNVREYDRRDNSIKIDIIVTQDEDFTIEVSA